MNQRSVVLSFVEASKVFRSRAIGSDRETVALDGFSLDFPEEPARVVAIAGESGSGKTTAANLALGFLTPSSGTVLYRGQSIVGLRRRDRTSFRKDIQAVTQDPFSAFNPFYRIRHTFDVVVRNFDVGDDRNDAERLVSESLEFVGLDPHRVLSAYPHQLSGGERQRVMVARAFLLRPRLIVADEPVSMVDASIRASILELMLRLRSEHDVSFMYITHDLSTAYHVADELIVLRRGVLAERGDARSVIDDPQHEYTKLLIDSVPVPDPDIRWGSLPEDV